MYTYGQDLRRIVSLRSMSAGPVSGLRDLAAIVLASENLQVVLSSEFDGDETAERGEVLHFL